MKLIKLLTAVVVLGGLGFNAHAQLGFEPGSFLEVEALKVQLTAHVQDDLEEIDNGVRQGIQKFKLNNKALKQLIGAPDNSRLVLLNGEQVGVQTSEGTGGTGIFGGLQDIGDTFLVSGKATETDSAFKQDITESYLALFEMTTNPEATAIDPDDIQDFQLNVIGKASERQKVVDGDQFDIRHAFSIEGAGEGFILTSLDEVEALFTGSISTSGKELDIVR